ncbi:hypothetical protein PMI04_014480 [Sphingobium sp. AP49]|uniref:hypothetical protein n=1 Tax=Sphingobium sp. AP49 TaxID=1144307 RepID=UPI00026ED0EE|nr:hypothetical protein [Sphingobium sp. AP49]WHO37768.1 hypothetical protein PMI04_014480 [Sphingobium sp. AP49]
MLLEDTEFPIVRMHYNRVGTRDDPSGFATFDRLLNRNQPFVLMGLGGSDEAHEHSPSQRKEIALWMKRNREPLHRLVRAMVYVEPHAAKRFVARAQAIVFGKAWGFPMVVRSSEQEARNAAERLLMGEAAETIAEEQPDA